VPGLFQKSSVHFRKKVRKEGRKEKRNKEKQEEKETRCTNRHIKK
jgi:hypothetical protein